MQPLFSIKGNGKLLLTGEYFVLDGAKALAVPAKFGQQLAIFDHDEPGLTWESYNSKGGRWFEARFSIPDFAIISSNNGATANALQKILLAARAENPSFLSKKTGLLAKSQLDFPNDWGLGSSSTLLYGISQWAKVDPFTLSDATFGGSGYDIACAAAASAIFYTRVKNKPKVEQCKYKPLFYNNLYFVHLGKKQNSRLGIQRYREKVKAKGLNEKITDLTHQFYSANSLDLLEEIILEHEKIIAESLDLPRAKELYFNDYWGEIKSLGAWGGDFILITNSRDEREMRDYFSKKGFETVLSFKEMVL